MKAYGLIGEKLGHSFSPMIHQEFGIEDYKLWEISRERIDDFLKKADFDGANVTIPYKENALRACSEADEASRLIGALNTLVKTEDGLRGYNTDYFGFEQMCQAAGISFEGRKIAILGSGGTSKTACYASYRMGAHEAVIVSRKAHSYELRYDFKASFVTYEEEEKYTDADILVNTTPVGMHPDIDGMPIELAEFSHLQGVVDVIYNPLTTRLITEAKKRGIKATNGLKMLVAQAYRADRLFQNSQEAITEKDIAHIDQVTHKLRIMKSNIVLIGMPGCGKSTQGRRIAKILGREFFDADDIFVKKYEITPAECIESLGEEEFRNKEEEIIKELSSYSGAIISTGGGCVLRNSNIRRLRLSGIVIFLNKPLDRLSTRNRPLSKSPEVIARMYQERLPLYQEAMDYELGMKERIEDTVQELMKLIEQIKEVPNENIDFERTQH